MEGDIHEHLVESPVDERSVDGDDRMKSPERETGGARRCVLLRDPHVVNTVGEALGELVQAGRAEHRRGDADDARIAFSESDDFVGENGRPRRFAGTLDRFARLRVDLPDGVELVGRVAHSGLIAAPLLRDHVHDDRSAVVLRLAERFLHRFDVVPLHRADVLDVKIRVEGFVVREPAEEPVEPAAHPAVERLAGGAEAVEGFAARQVEAAVAAPRTHRVEEARHPADGRRVGAAVVVDDDDEPSRVVVGDVVERFPRHPAGQRAVADHGDDVTVVLSGHREGARDAVRPRERARRVRALDDVMDRLRTLRVARESTALAEHAEVLPPGEQFVHVRLVAGVEDNGVPGRVEDPVDGDGRLDDAEVGAEVATRLGDVRDQELPDLGGELDELLLGESVQVAGTGDGLEDTHAFEFRRARSIKAQCRRFGRNSGTRSQDAFRPPGSAARTAGSRRCGSSRLLPVCRCGRPPRTRPSACPRESRHSAPPRRGLSSGWCLRSAARGP